MNAAAPAHVLAHADQDATAAACYHCGQTLAVSRWQASVGGVARPMCCPGCAAAAEAIDGAGLAGYYDSRSSFAAQALDAARDAPELALYDAANDGDAVFCVEGMRCAACVWLIERRVAALPGVLGAQLNVAAERLWVTWDPTQCRPSAILGALRAVGYTAYPYDAARSGARLERERKVLLRRLFVAGLSMMQVMMFAFPVYIADGTLDDSMDASMRALLQWASLLLTLPALAYSAWPFLRGACLDLRRGLPGMDVPVALGILAAFAGSLASLIEGRGQVWFDSITMFVFLLLGSRYLELNARRKAAGALERLRHAAPASALRLLDYPVSTATELVAAGALKPGDLVLVPPGQAAAADGVIVEGETEADLALLTGESRTRALGPGDMLPGGAVNASQAVVQRVTHGSEASTLALLVRLSERAGQDKPSLAQLADRVAGVFVLALLALSAAVFAVWHMFEPARAWPAAIAVLVVSCPCALSLATPTALAAALERLLRHGALVVKPHVLETLARCTHVVFDKTGTLTEGRPRLAGVRLFGAAGREACLRLAAALEAGSAHPLARALREAASGGEPRAPATCLAQRVGQGVEGEVDGQRYRLGSAAFVAALAGTPAPDDASQHQLDAGSAVWLGGQGRWLACFELVDALRLDARAVVEACRRRGKIVMLLSGDEDTAARALAARLGIEHAMGGLLPDQKLDVVRGLQREGAVVAMVGDGINDSAVLKGADVSFAMGQGAELAQLHADCVLLRDGTEKEGGLAPLAVLLATADDTLRVIRQNLGWALAYNLAAIPAAACGLLNPWLSGLGMALSSTLVVLNALRLRGDGSLQSVPKAG